MTCGLSISLLEAFSCRLSVVKGRRRGKRTLVNRLYRKLMGRIYKIGWLVVELKVNCLTGPRPMGGIPLGG